MTDTPLVERLRGLIERLEKPDHVEVRVDAATTLIKAAERSGILITSRTAGATDTFAGIPIVTDPIMPKGFAVILVNGEVSNILDLRALSQEQSK